MDNIKKIYQSDSGKAIKNHLENIVESLGDIETIEGNTPEMIAIETLSRQKAIILLRELLFLAEDPVETTKVNEDRLKKYGF